MKTPPPIMPSASAESSISEASSGRMSAITYISIPSVIQPTPAMMSSRHWYVPNWAAAKARSMAGSSMARRRNFWLRVQLPQLVPAFPVAQVVKSLPIWDCASNGIRYFMVPASLGRTERDQSLQNLPTLSDKSMATNESDEQLLPAAASL